MSFWAVHTSKPADPKGGTATWSQEASNFWPNFVKPEPVSSLGSSNMTSQGQRMRLVANDEWHTRDDKINGAIFAGVYIFC